MGKQFKLCMQITFHLNAIWKLLILNWISILQKLQESSLLMETEWAAASLNEFIVHLQVVETTGWQFVHRGKTWQLSTYNLEW